jgi:zinc protease
MRKRSPLCVLALLLCALSGVAQERRDLLAGLERRVLPNGLAVVVKEDRRIPMVTAMLAYRVGSANEERGITGASHFFEHMVFKGTEKYKRGDIDLVTYRCGGENNAFTTHDMTGYWFHVNAKHLDDVLDILADTMGNCTIDPQEFESEKNTVLQEMNIWLDGPWGELELELDKAVYRKSAYGHPVLGWREDVEKLTPERMKAYYKTHYRPQNASLVVVGDVAKADVFARAEKFFAKLPKGEDPKPPVLEEPPQKEARRVTLKTERAADRLMMAWRADAAGTESDIVLDVVATLLGDGRTSRLQHRLVEKEKLIGEGNLDVTNYSRRHEGVFSVQAELALGGSPEKTEEVVLEELRVLAERPVGERELRRAKNLIRANFAFEAESQYELASKIGYFEALGLPDYVNRYMDRVEAVTPAAVQATARKIFTLEGRTVVLGAAKAKRTSASVFRRGGPPSPRRSGKGFGGQAEPSIGEVREVKLENGLTVVVKSRRDFPVLAVQAFVDGGQLYEPEEKAGLVRLVGELLDEGTDDRAGRVRSSGQIAGDVEFVGGKLDTNANGAAVKVLSEHATVAFDLVRDLLRHASFPEDRFELIRSDLLAEIESMDDDPQGVARRLFYEQAFKGHPFHRPGVGYKATVEKLTRDDVLAYVRRFYRPENVIVAVAGDIDPDRAVEEVRTRFGSWKGEGPWEAPKPAAAVRQTEPRTSNRFFKAQQARLHLGHVGIDRKDPDFTALRVLETILCSSSGFTNRLARTVRDERGLAYDVGGSVTAGAGAAPGAFQVVLGVEAKDKDAALALVRKELGTFLEEGPTAQELEDARKYLTASLPGAWETNENVAAYLLEARRYGLGMDHAAKFHRAVSAMTREDVLRAARKHVDLKNLTTVVVGPKEGDEK